ncbi:MAG: fluoride efflux transporter CrcB [SAR202 cluster bacterium]|nr:fluoride efflux transporter CrcB [SAR202 cluster bacterium]
MQTVLLVGAGGFAGAIARYLLSDWTQSLFKGSAFPYGTLTVNILGCLAIGVLSGLVQSKGLLPVEIRTFLSIGLLGGFTTFSTFGNETFSLIRNGHVASAAGYVAVSVVVGVLAVWVGHMLSQAR